MINCLLRRKPGKKQTPLPGTRLRPAVSPASEPVGGRVTPGRGASGPRGFRGREGAPARGGSGGLSPAPQSPPHSSPRPSAAAQTRCIPSESWTVRQRLIASQLAATERPRATDAGPGRLSGHLFCRAGALHGEESGVGVAGREMEEKGLESGRAKLAEDAVGATFLFSGQSALAWGNSSRCLFGR